MDRTKLKNILGAGGLSVLAVTAFFTFDGPTSYSQLNGLEGSSVTTVTDVEASNVELAETLMLMQEREVQYQSQLEIANGVVTQLQTELTNTTISYEEVVAAYDGSLAELQTQNEELVQSVVELQTREGEWQANLEGSNQMISSLEDRALSTTQDALSLQEQNQQLTVAIGNLQTQYETAVTQANSTIYTLETQIGTVQGENTQLHELLLIMQDREAQYQAQIAAANQTISSLQNSGGGGGGYEDHEEYDDDDDDDDEEDDD